MKVSKIYYIDRYNLFTYLPSEISLDDVKANSDLNKLYLLELDMNEDGKTLKVIQLSILLAIHPIGRCATWDDVPATLSTIVIDAYQWPAPDMSNPSKAVKAISPMTSIDFDLSYTNLSVPEERNIKQFRHRLTDLGIKKTNPENPFNLENCLCFVNGLTSRPVVFNDELLMKNGAKYMASTTALRHPNVLLLDFSDFGGFEIIPLSECTPKYQNYTNLANASDQLKLILPNDRNIYDYTVFPVIGHTLFFPNSVQFMSARSLLLKPEMFRVGMSLMKQMAASGEFSGRTYVHQSPKTVEDYWLEEMFQEDHYGAFLVLVKTKDLYIGRSSTYNFCKTVSAEIGLSGFLYERSTQSFCDYTEVSYDSLKDLYTNEACQFLEPDSIDPLGAPIALHSCRCTHALNEMRDYSKTGFEMVRIIGI